ncbi:extracellular solute-binding protein [Kineothrix sp. MB12-C1]|uniref:extracellular solute-binding protein n=1 Tax=Kineothrix sp. MB12-C1 TaxID=3070215 RepID=UPI0027D2C394|nr:extracellular solute-binding protein [Kineothrix sp. MB12-C1]WMC91893.1 extracellular solute-binding protein [Kineothrix sp. MB12-C1]
MNRLFNEDKSHVPLAEIKANDSQYLSDFENGRVAMIPQGEWLFDMLMKDAQAGKTDVNWDVAPLPVPEGVEAGTTWGATQFAAIPGDSKHVEEAYEFLEYLCGDGGASVLPKFGILPSYSSEAGEDAFKEAIGKDSAVEVVFNAKRLPEAPAYDKYNDLIDAFTENAELYLYGEKGIDETMANFEAQREQIMSK